jgi:uncharacterized protein YdeI (YjbR/CyaY-like superfamily)
VTVELILRDAAAWRRWLSRNSASAEAWLVLGKKGADAPTRLTHADALEVAICFGWIDGVRHGRDAQTFLQRFTPRRARSPWSQVNVASAERLIAAGLMEPAGLAEVERARADGRWAAAYAGQATITVPDDLAQALVAEPKAAAMFAILTSQNRYAVLYRIDSAKRPETRARRIATFVAMLARGETVYPQRRTLDDGAD